MPEKKRSNRWPDRQAWEQWCTLVTPSLGKEKQGRHTYETSVVCTVSSRRAKATEWDAVSNLPLQKKSYSINKIRLLILKSMCDPVRKHGEENVTKPVSRSYESSNPTASFSPHHMLARGQYHWMLCDRTLPEVTQHTHLLTPDRTKQQTKVQIPTKSNLENQ